LGELDHDLLSLGRAMAPARGLAGDLGHKTIGKGRDVDVEVQVATEGLYALHERMRRKSSRHLLRDLLRAVGSAAQRFTNRAGVAPTSLQGQAVELEGALVRLVTETPQRGLEALAQGGGEVEHTAGADGVLGFHGA